MNQNGLTDPPMNLSCAHPRDFPFRDDNVIGNEVLDKVTKTGGSAFLVY